MRLPLKLKTSSVALNPRKARYSTAPIVQRSAFRGLPR